MDYGGDETIQFEFWKMDSGGDETIQFEFCKMDSGQISEISENCLATVGAKFWQYFFPTFLAKLLHFDDFWVSKKI